MLVVELLVLLVWVVLVMLWFTEVGLEIVEDLAVGRFGAGIYIGLVNCDVWEFLYIGKRNLHLDFGKWVWNKGLCYG